MLRRFRNTGRRDRRFRDRRLIGEITPIVVPRKEEAACCVARADEYGRLPVGFCSPGCLRRRARDAQQGVRS